VNLLELSLLAGYVATSIAIGALGRLRAGDEDFVIGERQIEQLGTTMSIFATMVTESSIFFTVGLTVLYGPLGAVAAILGPAVALFVLSFIAANAHQRGARERYVSISDYCQREWGRVTGRMAKAIFMLLMAWVVVLQINLNSKLLAGLLSWSTVSSTLLVVVVVLFYLTASGYRAVIRTDVFQGFVLGAVLFLPLVIEPAPAFPRGLFAQVPSVNVVLILLMSFALTIVRPELWQRIYSARTPAKAVWGLRTVGVLYAVFGGFVLYYALAVTQSAPSLGPDEAFALGYREVLPPFFAALFPVLLLAAMMSSLDSATFLLSVDLTSLHNRLLAHRKRWVRAFVASLLIAGGLVSLTIFDSLGFAYKINGLVVLFTAPLLVSFWRPVSMRLLGASLVCGLATYGAQIVSGRVDANPVESTLAGLVTAGVLLGGLVVRFLRPGERADQRREPEALGEVVVEGIEAPPGRQPLGGSDGSGGEGLEAAD
jgi:SSS family solute:Na+ symporter